MFEGGFCLWRDFVYAPWQSDTEHTDHYPTVFTHACTHAHAQAQSGEDQKKRASLF